MDGLMMRIQRKTNFSLQVDEMENTKQFDLLKFLGNLLFAIFVVIMSALILITAQARFTGQEPALFGVKLYIVDSQSMSPSIKLDSMIVVKELKPADIREEDIITYYSNDNSTRVTHRVVEVKDRGKTLITKGDANNTNDPRPLDGDRVIGKVIFIIPLIGRVFRFLSTTEGIISLMVIGSLWIVVPKLCTTKGIKDENLEGTSKLNDSQEVRK